jgi:hypothetical protein
MSAPTVRISEASYQILKELAEKTGQSMMDVLDTTLDAYRRKLFFEQHQPQYIVPRSRVTRPARRRPCRPSIGNGARSPGT